MELELYKKLIEHFFSELEYVTWVFTQCGSRKIMRYVLNCKEHVFFSLYYCFLNWGRLSIFIENQTSKNNNHKKTQLFSVHGVTKWLDLIFIRHNAAFDKHLPIIQASMHIRNTFYFSHFSSPFYSGPQKDAEKTPNHGTYFDFTLGISYKVLFPVLDRPMAQFKTACTKFGNVIEDFSTIVKKI